MRLHLFVSTMAVALAACSPAAVRGGPTPSGSDVLFASEIVKAQVLDTYQAVSQLRPQFLKLRGPLLPTANHLGLRVFLDDMDVGGVDALRSIPIEQVTAIRYLDASDAQFRWGNDHPYGVILVLTSRVLGP
jgi:hypothetical protein